METRWEFPGSWPLKINIIRKAGKEREIYSPRRLRSHLRRERKREKGRKKKKSEKERKNNGRIAIIGMMIFLCVSIFYCSLLHGSSFCFRDLIFLFSPFPFNCCVFFLFFEHKKDGFLPSTFFWIFPLDIIIRFCFFFFFLCIFFGKIKCMVHSTWFFLTDSV